MTDGILAQLKLEDDKGVVIRYPKLGDLVQMTSYINILSKEQTYILFQGNEISIKHEKDYLKKLLFDIKKKMAVQLLAFHNNQLVGITDIKMKEHALIHEGVFGITIAKEFRGLGLGKKIMKLVIDEAVKNIPQLQVITLSVFSDNSLAQNLYKSFGFKEFGKLPKIIEHKDHLDDHVYMYKRVRY